MPRIVAASVEANRDLRQAAILQAAIELAHSEGLAKVTVGEVARKAGLARSSVYAYFDSSADLIAEVLVEELIEMCEMLAEGVKPANTPVEAIGLWMRTSMAMIADGRHQVIRAAAGMDLPATRKAQLSQLHRRMSVPLMEALSAHGVANPMRVAQQIAAVVDVAVRGIEHGGNPAEEIAAAERFVLEGIKP